MADLIKQAGLPVYLANMNAPDQTIIAAAETHIDKAVEVINAKGIRAKRIPVSAPFHTPLLEAGSHAMAEHFAKANFRRPSRPVYSNTTGKRHSDQADEIRDLLTRHFSEPVHFEEEIRQIYADGARVFIECGPGKVLTELTQRILKDQPIVTMAIDIPGRDGWTQLGHALARAFVVGLPVETSQWFAGRGFASLGVKEFLADLDQRTIPKKSDWILGPTKAEPAFSSQKQKDILVTPAIIGLIGKADEVRSESARPAMVQPASAEPATVASVSAELKETPVIAPKPAVPAELLAAAPKATPIMAASPTATAPVTLSPPAQSGEGLAYRLGRQEGSKGFRRSLTRPLTRSLLQQSRTQPRPAPRTQLRKSPAMTPYQTSSPEANGSPNGTPPAGGVDLFMELQTSTRMFLEFQQTQQVLMERFLDTQERLLALCLGKGPAPTAQVAIAPPAYSPTPIAAPIAPAPAPYVNGHVAPAPAPVAHTAPAPAPAAPPAAKAPISMPGVKTPTTTPPAFATLAAKPTAPAPAPAPVPAAPVASAPVAKPAAPAAPPAPAAGGPPPVEEFRKDLLAVISERTGYPEDMLDEELPLEAGLGIDSIKTVEVFSTLKKYHPFMRDEDRDEEETLAEFTKLKTIKDIIDAYAGRLARLNGAAPASSNGPVERHVVTTAAAPAGEASKKNSLAST